MKVELFKCLMLAVIAGCLGFLSYREYRHPLTITGCPRVMVEGPVETFTQQAIEVIPAENVFRVSIDDELPISVQTTGVVPVEVQNPYLPVEIER